MNRYYCPACRRRVTRSSWKLWLKSYCSSQGRDVRMWRVSL